jgi:predicted double-glycine peptidase
MASSRVPAKAGGEKMGGWFEIAGVITAAFLGGFAGRLFSRLKNPHWGWGYCLPLMLAFLLLLITYAGLNASNPFFAWISSGRLRFVLIALSVTMGAMTLIGRLTNRFQKALLFVVMIGVVAWGALMPFAMPLIIKKNLAQLPTLIDADNVCFQSTPYTCGPAAAVTALGQLGIRAHEGELAILSHTSPIIGTMPWDLYKAIEDRYAADGVDCRFRHFDSISQLREAGVTLAVVRDAFLLDHCVAVIEVGENTVTIGDPVLGKTLMTHKDFQNIWRFYGIALKLNHT